jgi:hypothetical protein
MLDQGIFEFRFGVFIFEIEEFEDERVFDGLFRRNRIARLCLCSLFQHCGFVSGQGNALIELAFDLPVQLPHGPARSERFGFVERSRLGSFHGQQANVRRPGQRERRCRRLNVGRQ